MVWRKSIFSLIIFSITSANAAFLPPAKAKHGMVSTAQHIATGVGLTILREGGNAIDAAVAIGYAEAVVHPCCGNLGGGGFMLIHLANGNNVFVNFREKAPMNISGKLFFDHKGKLKPGVLKSFLPVGIPGTVMGLNSALKKYGTMSLQKVMAPAIALAKKGFVLQPFDVHILSSLKSGAKEANVAKIFLNHGKPYQVGERLRQPQLARTLESISKQGSKVFYHGWIAKEIVRSSNQRGGVLSLKDFANYSVQFTRPIACNYRGMNIVTGPPPSSGTTVCEILNIVSGYPLAAMGLHSAASVHYNVEAMRYAYFDRNRYLGDPTFVNNPLDRLLSLTYAKKIRERIKPNVAGVPLSVHAPKEKMQTTNYSVVDKQGNTVDVTYTLNGFFGNQKIAGRTGFFLNNELDDFAFKVGMPNMFKLVQGRANLIEPNKRPLSSMSPTLVMQDGKPIMVLGAAGGSTIITTIVEAIEHSIDFKMDVNAAINVARYHMQGLPNKIYMEPFVFSKDTMNKLEGMGYKLHAGSVYDTPLWGQASVVSIDPVTSMRLGANDNRRPDGLAAGY